MIQLGTALKCLAPPFHRCLVISDPQTNGGHVVLVRLTTDDGKWPDRDCVLTAGDWGRAGARFDGCILHMQVRQGCGFPGKIHSRWCVSGNSPPIRRRAAQGDCGWPHSRRNASWSEALPCAVLTPSQPPPFGGDPATHRTRFASIGAGR